LKKRLRVKRSYRRKAQLTEIPPKSRIFHAGAFTGIRRYLACTERLVDAAQDMWIAVYLHTVRTIVAVISGGVGQSGKKRDGDCAAQKDKTHVNLPSVFWWVMAKKRQ
jgi:hypothetical protein